MKRLSDVLFQIKHAKNSKPVVVHADNIKPYRGNKQYPSKRDPQYTSDPEYTSDQLQMGPVTHRRTSARRRRPNPLKMPRNLPPVSDSKSPAPTAKDFNQSEDEVRMTRRGRVLKRPARFRDWPLLNSFSKRMAVCNICGIQLCSVCALNQHCREQHTTSVKIMKCNYCQRPFRRMFNLRRHTGMCSVHNITMDCAK